MARIAVEHPFRDVQNELKKMGYNVDMPERDANLSAYDVIVVRDQSENTFTHNHTEASLVEASGRTVNDIVEDVVERLRRMGKTVEPPKESGGGGKMAAGLVTGAVVGAAAGLLLTPKKGKDLQQNIKEKVSSGSDGETLENVKEKAHEMTDEVKQQSEEMLEDAGVKEKIEEQKQKAEETAESLKRKAKVEKDRLTKSSEEQNKNFEESSAVKDYGFKKHN